MFIDLLLPLCLWFNRIGLHGTAPPWPGLGSGLTPKVELEEQTALASRNVTLPYLLSHPSRFQSDGRLYYTLVFGVGYGFGQWLYINKIENILSRPLKISNVFSNFHIGTEKNQWLRTDNKSTWAIFELQKSPKDMGYSCYINVPQVKIWYSNHICMPLNLWNRNMLNVVRNYKDCTGLILWYFSKLYVPCKIPVWKLFLPAVISWFLSNYRAN